MFTNILWEEIFEIIVANRRCNEYELEQYREEIESKPFLFESIEELLDDFDMWQEELNLTVEKTLDSLYWSSI
jgi:hypothetical protein